MNKPAPLNLAAAFAVCASILCFSGAALAKLPAPSDEAKAKAAEASAKAAHAGKVDGYKLCLSMDKVAAHYAAAQKKAAKELKPPTPTAACADPGAFVYPLPVAAAPAATVPVAAAAAAPAKPAAAAPAPKK